MCENKSYRALFDWKILCRGGLLTGETCNRGKKQNDLYLIYYQELLFLNKISMEVVNVLLRLIILMEQTAFDHVLYAESKEDVNVL